MVLGKLASHVQKTKTEPLPYTFDKDFLTKTPKAMATKAKTDK